MEETSGGRDVQRQTKRMDELTGPREQKNQRCDLVAEVGEHRRGKKWACDSFDKQLLHIAGHSEMLLSLFLVQPSHWKSLTSRNTTSVSWRNLTPRRRYLTLMQSCRMAAIGEGHFKVS